MINKNLIGIVLMVLMFSVSPVFGAPDDYTISDDSGDSFDSSSGTSVVQSLVNPLAGLNEVLNSPAGKPIKKVLNLVIGFAILYTIGTLIKDYLDAQSGNSEKSSSGFLNMGKHSTGLLVLLICLGFVGVFMNYNV